MSATMLAVLVDALTQARPVIAANLDAALAGACLLNRDLTPIRTTLPEDDRLWVESHEDALRRIDSALERAKAAA